MLGTGVPSIAPRGQISLLIITIFSCGLSFWLTLRFCGTLAPGHACLELVAMGIAWELAKLTFGSLGARRIRSGDTWGERVSGYALLGVSSVLAAGSIVASLAFLGQTERRVAQQAEHAAQQTWHASEAYARDSGALAALDQEIRETTTLAKQYRDQGLLTRSAHTLARVGELRAARLARAEALSEREISMTPPDVTPGGVMLFGPASAWRPAAQGVLAVMLEIIGMVALSLLRGRDGPALPGVRAASDATMRLLHPQTASGAARQNDTSAHGSAAAAATAGRDVSGSITALHGSRAAALLHGTADRGAAHCSAPSDAAVAMSMHHAAAKMPAAAPTARGRREDARRLQALYEQARQMVRSAQLQPRYREMQRALGVSQVVVQRFLARLVAEGVLCRRGSAYVPTTHLDASEGAA